MKKNITYSGLFAPFFFCSDSIDHTPPLKKNKQPPPMQSFSMYDTSFDVVLLNNIVESTPTTYIPITTLKHMMDRMTWMDRENNHLTPNMILHKPWKSPDHSKRILDAECQVPILITTIRTVASVAGRHDILDNNDADVIIVVDGMHRLAHAFATGLVVLPCKNLHEDQLTAARVDPVF